MRRLILAATVAALAGAGSLVSTRADAMPANGGLGASVAHELTEQVHLVCERRWDGYRWVRACYETGPGYYYGGGPSIYFGFGGGGFHHHHHGHHGGHHFGHHGGHGGHLGHH